MDEFDDRQGGSEPDSDDYLPKFSSDAQFWCGTVAGFLIIGVLYFWMHQSGI
jgi:hypothetical protein